MAIVAILTGGLFGSLTALIALFGVGVEWSTGLTVYFATATLFAMPILGMGMYSRSKIPVGPQMSDWEREFQSSHPNSSVGINTFDRDTRETQDRSAA